MDSILDPQNEALGVSCPFRDSNTDDFVREKCFCSLEHKSCISEFSLSFENALFLSVITQSYPFKSARIKNILVIE